MRLNMERKKVLTLDKKRQARKAVHEHFFLDIEFRVCAECGYVDVHAWQVLQYLMHKNKISYDFYGLH